MADTEHSLSRAEAGPVIAVSLISALRLLGIFLMLPVFSVYAVRYPGASAALAGVAFGIYALITELDAAAARLGQRPLGPQAGVADPGSRCSRSEASPAPSPKTIFQLIIARIIQGAGAVGSVAFAALADVTRPSVRTQAYTITGIAIGSAFMIGILAGPLLAARIGLDGLFYLLADSHCSRCFSPPRRFRASAGSADNEPPLAVAPIASRPGLRPIFLAAFVLSLALNLFFFTYPLSWNDLGLDKTALWKVYLIIFLPSVLLVFPYVRWAEKRGRFRAPLLLGWL